MWPITFRFINHEWTSKDVGDSWCRVMRAKVLKYLHYPKERRRGSSSVSPIPICTGRISCFVSTRVKQTLSKRAHLKMLEKRLGFALKTFECGQTGPDPLSWYLYPNSGDWNNPWNQEVPPPRWKVLIVTMHKDKISLQALVLGWCYF